MSLSTFSSYADLMSKTFLPRVYYSVFLIVFFAAVSNYLKITSSTRMHPVLSQPKYSYIASHVDEYGFSSIICFHTTLTSRMAIYVKYIFSAFLGRLSPVILGDIPLITEAASIIHEHIELVTRRRLGCAYLKLRKSVEGYWLWCTLDCLM